MKLSVQVIVHPDDDGEGSAVVREVFVLDRDVLAPDALGLRLAEAPDVLVAVQDTMLAQVQSAVAAQSACPDCGKPRRHKDTTDRKARPSVALVDVNPTTRRARLSYRRAAKLFEQHTADLPGGPFTLHQLHHSGLTHAAEDGVSTPILMALSGHTSVRSLAKYACVSAEALAHWQAERDLAGRRAGGRR